MTTTSINISNIISANITSYYVSGRPYRKTLSLIVTKAL